MARAYPMELRERVVEALNNGEGTYQEIADRFSVGVATVDRWLALERRNGSVAPAAAGGARHPLKLTAEAEVFVVGLLAAHPECTLGELVAAVQERLSITMSERTMGRSLARLDITRKRGPFARHRRSDRTSLQRGMRSSRR